MMAALRERETLRIANDLSRHLNAQFEPREPGGRIQGVYERAKNNEDFGQLAISYSDSGTALEGGALGWRKAGQLPSFVADVIPTMKPGDVTEPIRTPTGLHIFKVLDVRGGEAPALISQVHARHVLMKPNEVEDDETVRQKLAAIRARVLKGESFASSRELFDSTPQVLAGFERAPTFQF